KISEHHVDCAEMIAWRDEQGGLPLKWAEDTVVRSGTFQESQRGRSHRDDTTAFLPHLVEGVRGPCGDAGLLRVHAMPGGIGGLDRKERPGADVQRYRMQADPTRNQE